MAQLGFNDTNQRRYTIGMKFTGVTGTFRIVWETPAFVGFENEVTKEHISCKWAGLEQLIGQGTWVPR
jgi:hypothetical protein